MDLVRCTDQQISALRDRAVHQFNWQLFVDLSGSMLDHINFPGWVAHKDVLLGIKASWDSHKVQVHLVGRPAALILEYRLRLLAADVCLNDLLDL